MSTSARSTYRHDPFRAKKGKKRGKRKTNVKKICSPKKRRLSGLSKGSFYDKISENEQQKAVYSASHKKLLELSKILSNEPDETQSPDQDSSDDETSDDYMEYRDVETKEEQPALDHSKYFWITDFNALQTYLKDVAVCKECHHSLLVRENTNFRDGLATKFSFECVNKLCSSIKNNNGFFTTNKDKRMYEINRASVLGSRIIGKGRAGLLKLCSVIGLSTPVNIRKVFLSTQVCWRKKPLNYVVKT